MITQADVNKFLNEFGINNNLMEKLIKESVDIGLKENIKLKQTLTEIKEIANKFDYWNNNLSQASEILHEIIEKISEVLDDTSNR